MRSFMQIIFMSILLFGLFPVHSYAQETITLEARTLRIVNQETIGSESVWYGVIYDTTQTYADPVALKPYTDTAVLDLNIPLLGYVEYTDTEPLWIVHIHQYAFSFRVIDEDHSITITSVVSMPGNITELWFHNARYQVIMPETLPHIGDAYLLKSPHAYSTPGYGYIVQNGMLYTIAATLNEQTSLYIPVAQS